MTEKDFKAFMYIGANKMLICIFSKIDSKILYKNEYKFSELKNQINEIRLIDFLTDNIYLLEKDYFPNIDKVVEEGEFLKWFYYFQGQYHILMDVLRYLNK